MGNSVVLDDLPLTEEGLVAYYRQALCEYEAAVPGSTRRIDKFVELATCEVALMRRFGHAYPLQRRRNRHTN